MAEIQETRTERISVAVTPTEKRALEIIAEGHGDRYDGPSTVVRDYSLTQAVSFVRRVTAEVTGAV